MNEWVHVAISALGSVIGVLSLFILHDIRDRVVRLEESRMSHSEDIAEIRGQLKGF